MIGGILYLHRISDIRVSGSALRSFRLLESICGLDAAGFLAILVAADSRMDILGISSTKFKPEI